MDLGVPPSQDQGSTWVEAPSFKVPSSRADRAEGVPAGRRGPPDMRRGRPCCSAPPARPRAPDRVDSPAVAGKGAHGVSTDGVTANFMSFDRGRFSVSRLAHFRLPQQCQDVLFPTICHKIGLLLRLFQSSREWARSPDRDSESSFRARAAGLRRVVQL